jgi:hypothetical protein
VFLVIWFLNCITGLTVLFLVNIVCYKLMVEVELVMYGS